MVESSKQQYEVPQAKMKEYKFLPEEVTDMVSNFKTYDTNKDDTISKQEFCTVLKNLGMTADPDKLFDKFDKNSDGVISWEEYVVMMGTVKAKKAAVLGATKRKAEEISAVTRMVNNKMAKDKDEYVLKRLPIDTASEDIFYEMSDGCIFIKLLNLMDEDAVDMRTINKYEAGMNKMAMVVNIE